MRFIIAVAALRAKFNRSTHAASTVPQLTQCAWTALNLLNTLNRTETQGSAAASTSRTSGSQAARESNLLSTGPRLDGAEPWPSTRRPSPTTFQRPHPTLHCQPGSGA